MTEFLASAGDTVAIASDHAGLDMKKDLVPVLEDLGFTVDDLGTHTLDSVDYPDFGRAMADALGQGTAKAGVIVCGTGIGISIAANRHLHVRAALVHDHLTAQLAREHNDANVVAVGARVTGIETAKDCVRAFFSTPFAGGRHQRRVNKLGEPALAPQKG